MSLCVCVCVYVCVCEREREIDGKREKDIEKALVSVCIFVIAL